MPSAQRSGLSASVGLVLVIGLLLVAVTLAVSGGGILTSGGRLGVAPVGSGSPAPGSTVLGATDEPALPLPTTEGGSTTPVDTPLTHELAYTCAPEPGAIRDANKAKWRINQFQVGDRTETDRVTWEMTKVGKGKKATQAGMEWMDVKQAKETFGLAQLSGQRAIVITFDGPVSIVVDQRVDAAALEAESVAAIRAVQQFKGADGKIRTVIGVRGEGCVTMSAPLWKTARDGTTRSKVFLDIEKP